jgi:glycosyltransferase involved in cell wall biosynthesis
MGVDIKRYAPGDADDRRESRTRLGLPQSALVVLYVGRVRVDKGILEFCRAIDGLVKRGYECEGLIAGPRERTSDSRELALDESLKSPLIRWTNAFVDSLDYYRAADVFCLPSYREGLANTLLEASACGLPIVASDLPAIREVLCDPAHGVLVEPKNSEALLVALARLADDAPFRKTMGAAARQHVRLAYDSQLVSQRLNEFYKLVTDINGQHLR